MQSNLEGLPIREKKPRVSGMTMVMDKGLSIRQAEDLLDAAGELIDFIKLGFGTSLFTGKVKEKVALYRSAGVRVYPGGTLFEAFYIRNQTADYLRWVDYLGCDTLEVSDGCVLLPHDQKCDLIKRFSEHYYVLSEVGSKDADVEIETSLWVEMTQQELSAGSSVVIAEARESGTVGIYDACGKANTTLIEALTSAAGSQHIMWEAPMKSQQAWFINQLGSDVNLGNIAPEEVISLETLRTGLRGDTFFRFINTDQPA
jgi:phosphosulfolactate synthase